MGSLPKIKEPIGFGALEGIVKFLAGLCRPACLACRASEIAQGLGNWAIFLHFFVERSEDY